jgi:LmbE family N-acetylglucosaminyl deacetylase
VDISDTLPLKLQAIQAYKTQFPPKKERVYSLIEGYNRLLGQNAGFEAGELFYATSLLGVKDLVHFISVRAPVRTPLEKTEG